jgi:hypothetical protein
LIAELVFLMLETAEALLAFIERGQRFKLLEIFHWTIDRRGKLIGVVKRPIILTDHFGEGGFSYLP